MNSILVGMLTLCGVMLAEGVGYVLSDEVDLMKLEYSRDFEVAGDPSDDAYWYGFKFETSYAVQSISVSNGAYNQTTNTPQNNTGSGLVWYIKEWSSTTPFDADLDGNITVTFTFTDNSTASTIFPFTLEDGTTPIPAFVDEPLFTSPENLNGSAMYGLGTVFEWAPVPAGVNYFEIGHYTYNDDNEELLGLYASEITPADGPVSTTTTGYVPLPHGLNTIPLYRGYLRIDTNADGVDYVIIKLAENYQQFFVAGPTAAFDDFNDNAINGLKWTEIWTDPADDLTEMNGRLEYDSATGRDGGPGMEWIQNPPSGTQNWSMVVNAAFIVENPNIELCLSVEGPADAFVLKFYSEGSGDYKLNSVAFDLPTESGYLDAYQNIPNRNETLLRLDFDAAAQTLTSSYDRDGSFQTLETISTAGWGLSGSSEFTPILYVDNHNISVAPGEVYFDNFMIWRGNNGDGDKDGLLDEWEIQYFGSTSAPNANAEANGDSDSHKNWQEAIAGTDPTNGTSVFAVTNAVPSPSGFVLNWTPVEGRTYTVEWTDSLTNSFQTLETGISHPQNSYTDTVHAAEDGGFYNLNVELE